jgi:hypothetical protein
MVKECPKCGKVIFENTSHQCPRDRVEAEFDKELEAVEKVADEIREERKQPFSLKAFDIHPNALRGLIPIDGPLVINDRNQTLGTKMHYFDYEEENYLNPFLPYNFPLIAKAVTKAKIEDCRYILEIIHVEDNRYAVRAC